MGNILFLFVAALIPMLVGSIYYGPIFGNAWMRVNGFTKESLEGGNMPLIMGLSYFLSVVFAFGLTPIVIHQLPVDQLLGMHPDAQTAGTQVGDLLATIRNDFGTMHRSFGHGALHGGIAAIFTALPLIAINALFEQRGGKYIGIHFGYWFITMTLMGGILCQWY